MPDPIITLTTDFGEGSPYVAAMKGVIIGINPAARLLDLTHKVPPQHVRHAAFFLAGAVPYFPPDVIHVIVVDPGVGTQRALLYVEVDGHRLLVPDNGCWTRLVSPLSRPIVRRLTEPRYWRRPVSTTFHGRDILAPSAAHLSLGVAPASLGPLTEDWVRLDFPSPVLTPDRLAGEVVFIDDFGNLLTNIPGEAFRAFSGRRVRIAVGEQEVTRIVRTYGEAEPGTPVALISSSGELEIAVNHGSAAVVLQAGMGTRVVVMT
jgi:S-adenosylmethionine hydrolase